MRVPDSLTKSAVMPCGRPSRLTRSRNAGGNANSRPHSRPTFIDASSDAVRARRLLDAVARLFDDGLHDRPQIVRLPVHVPLAIGARALGKDGPDVLDLAAAAQLVGHIGDELEELERELTERHLGAAAEVDQLSVQPPPRRAPFVLFDESAMIEP